MVPACFAKSRLTMPGNSTPITPMLAPATTLPANKPNSPRELRRMIPPARVSRIPSTTRSLPKRRASNGARGAARPRQSTGKVVNRPALAADKPRLRDTSPSNGAMLDNAGRRFKATSTRPSSNSQGRRNTGCCCWTRSSSASASISSRSSSTGREAASGSTGARDMGLSFSRFIDQAPAQGLGALGVLLLHRFEQGHMQVEHRLTTGGDIQGLAQGAGDHAGKVAVQLAEHRVVRGVDQALMKHQVATDKAVEIAVIVVTAGMQGLAQTLEIFLGTPQGRQADGLDFKAVPRLASLVEGTARQRLHGRQRIDGRSQIAAVALANLDQPGKRQRSQGFPHGVTADAQLRGQFRLGRQPLAHGPGATGNAFTQLLQGLVDQGAFDKGNALRHEE